jgi:glycosyltransferase involved in cell wall biosynthesis
MSAPVGVLYVANASKIGGGNRVLMDLVTGLDRDRFRAHLVAPSDGALGEWAASVGVPCDVIPDGDWDGRIGLARRTAQLVALALRTRSSIVHAMSHTCYRAAGVAAAAARAARLCHLGFPPGTEELRWSFQCVPDAVVACYTRQADEVRQQLGTFACEARVVAIPNGIDVDRFSPRPAEYVKPDWCRASRVVLIAGHLSDVKGHPTFFSAASRIAASHPDCSFVALGGETTTPGYRRFLEGHVADLGLADRVQFLGWRDDVADVFRAADLIVMPSQAEGLPLALLEAMACGRPIIATRVGGVPEAITDSVNGLLVAPDDVDALAAAMTAILDDDARAQRLGAQARASAEQRFSVSRVVRTTTDLYEDVAS